MAESQRTTIIFTGSEIMVNLIKEELKNNGIPSIIQNDFKSGLTAGFSGGTPSAVDLSVDFDDVDEAKRIINDIIEEIDQ